MENPTEKKEPYVHLFVFAVVLALIIALVVRKKDAYFSEINEEFETTIGWITSYHDRRFTDLSSDRVIGYSFKVDSVIYSRSTFTMAIFIECEDLSEQCKKKRFRVAYSKKDPSKSLIDFNIEVQGLNKIEKPKDIFDFR